LISASELHQGMRSHACCPAILLKLLDHWSLCFCPLGIRQVSQGPVICMFISW
jgi:origin recognition complex subunit 4